MLNPYRHLLRQEDSTKYYMMQQDVYSLGVYLVENIIACDLYGTAQLSTAL